MATGMEPSQTPETAPERLASIDVYRGFVMFLMAAEALRIGAVAARFPESGFWKFLAHHTSHVEWSGCALHDMIQPSFSFLVGAALPYSIANRRRRGQTTGLMLAHAAWRSLILIFLGVFLRSVGHARTNFTFEDTLSQIGLGYFFLFLLGLAQVRWRWVALAGILIGYWALFALYPFPAADFDYATVGVSEDWRPNLYEGFRAHWNINSNPAWAFDKWFLNLLPRENPFEFNRGGYSTISFIPTLGTMILGLIAGGWLRSNLTPAGRFGALALAGALGFAAGYALDRFGICPSVKKIWTPAWVLYSGGICFWFLAGFYAVLDWLGFRAWAFPLKVIGMNSIAMYCLVHLIEGFLLNSLDTHLPTGWGDIFGTDFTPLVRGAVLLAIFWLMLFWMYRRKIFLRV